MALYLAIFMGGTPVGAPLIGWVGEEFGARWTILLGGIVAMITAVLSVVWLQRTGRVHIRAQAAWPFLVVDEPAPPAAATDVEPVMTDGAEPAAPGHAEPADPGKPEPAAGGKAEPFAPGEAEVVVAADGVPVVSDHGEADAARSPEVSTDRDSTGDVRDEQAPSARPGTQEARREKARTEAAAVDAGDTISAA